MKKFTSKLLLVMMVLAMAFSIAACGSEKNDSTTNDSQGSVSNNTNSQSEADDSSAQTQVEKKQYASVADYVSSDEVQYVQSLFETQLEGSGMSLEILAEGDKLVYSYKMDDIDKADLTDEEIAALGSSVEAETATFQDTADEVKKLVEAEAPALVIRYLDVNGEEIYSKEFPAQ